MTPVVSTAAAHVHTGRDLHDHHFSMSRYIDTLQTSLFPDWLALLTWPVTCPPADPGSRRHWSRRSGTSCDHQGRTSGRSSRPYEQIGSHYDDRRFSVAKVSVSW